MKMLHVIAVLLSAVPAVAQSPDLDEQFPYYIPPVREMKYGGYTIDKDKLPDNPQPRVFTKSFLIGHGVYLAANVFDIEMTHQGIAHHRCVEGGFDGERHPARGEMYAIDMTVLTFSTLVDALFKYELNQPNNHTKWLAWTPFTLAGWGTVGHLRGGIKWYANCW